MSGLALVCHRLGATVTGSDRAESSYLAGCAPPGSSRGSATTPTRCPPDAEVVVSTAIADDNPELARARERGQRVIHRGELLAELCARKRLIAVAGTHGKTTTAGMLAHACGRSAPTRRSSSAASCRAPAPAASRRTRAGGAGSGSSPRPTSPTAASSSCGPRSRWSPTSSSTTIRAGASRAELIDAFGRFAAPASRRSACSAEPRTSIAVAGRPGRRRVSASTPSAPGPARLELAVPGRHNLLNARGALARARARRARRRRGGRGRSSAFPGCSGAWSARAHATGAAIYDDYAHHPTEVAAALEALRELEPRRLIAVFQPHLYSRTKALAGASAPPSPPPTRSACSTSTRPASSRWASSPESAASTSPGPRPTAPAGGRSGGCATPSRRRRALSQPRLGEGDLLVTLGAGDVVRARRRRWSTASDERARRSPARLPAGAADHGSRRRHAPTSSRGPDTERELVELLAWAGGEGARGRDRRLGLEPARLRRRGSAGSSSSSTAS